MRSRARRRRSTGRVGGVWLPSPSGRGGDVSFGASIDAVSEAILPVGPATIARPARAGISSNGEHQATAQARPHPGARAEREPALPLHDQDAEQAPRDGCRRWRCRPNRRRASRARSDDRSCGDAWSAASEHRRAQEVAGRATRRRRFRLGACPESGRAGWHATRAARQGRRERQYAGILARPRTPHRGAWRLPGGLIHFLDRPLSSRDRSPARRRDAA